MRHITECKKCGHKKTWDGDDINCPFQEADIFTDDNWNCGLIGDIRKLCKKAMDGKDERLNYQCFEDQTYVTIRTYDIDENIELGLCLWVSWYKSRGRTEAMWILSEYEPPRKPTYQELEKIIKYYE